MSINRAKALKSAQKYLAKGQIDRAISEYEKVVEEDPKDARSLLKLGDLYTRAGDAKGAIGAYRKVAEQYASQGFFLKAVAVYKQILKLDKADLAAWERLASMYEKLSLASDALTTFEQVADAYTRMGKAKEALRSLGKVAELDPENVASWIRYAESLSKADHIEEAAEAFRRGANLLKQQGRMDDYLKVAERLLFHNNEDVGLAREVAAMYLERGNAKAALSHLQTSFKADPRDVATLELLAQAFQVLGQMKKAAAVYREIARVHADADRSEDEAQALRGVLSLAPEDPESQRRLDEIGTRSVEIVDDTDDDMDDVIIVDEGSGVAAAPRPSSAPPASKEAQIARLLSECEVFVRYGLRDKVISQLNKVLDLDPDHIQARERLKDGYLQDGQIDEALTQLLLLSEIVGGSDPQRARGYLAEAAQLSPDNAPVASRLRELQSVVPANDVPSAFAGDEAGYEDEAEHEAEAEYEYEDEDEDEDELIILDEEEDTETGPVGAAAFDDESTFGDVRISSAPPDPGEDDGAFAELMAEADADTHAEVETYAALDDDDDPELLLEDSGETLESLDLDDSDLLDEPAPTPTPSPSPRFPPPGRTLIEPSIRIRPPTQVSVPPPIPRVAVSQPIRPPITSKIAPPPVSPPPDSLPPASLDPDSFPPEPATSPSHRVMSDEEVAELPEEITDALEEADFYIAQELLEEARGVVEDALSDFPDHPALTAKLRELDAAGSTEEDTDRFSLPAVGALSSPSTTEDQSFALAQKLADEVRSAGQSGPVGVDEVLHQFKEGVKNQVDRSDTATHYDLGIAYMEMGLHAEAIEEFRLCLDNPDKECTAHTMIGLSYVSKGDMLSGIDHFQQALASPGATAAEELDLWFEIGNAYELLGKASEALVWYEKVEERNPEFRDVAARIERLGHVKSEQEEVDEFDAMFDNMILKD